MHDLLLSASQDLQKKTFSGGSVYATVLVCNFWSQLCMEIGNCTAGTAGFPLAKAQGLSQTALGAYSCLGASMMSKFRRRLFFVICVGTDWRTQGASTPLCTICNSTSPAALPQIAPLQCECRCITSQLVLRTTPAALPQIAPLQRESPCITSQLVLRTMCGDWQVLMGIWYAMQNTLTAHCSCFCSMCLCISSPRCASSDSSPPARLQTPNKTSTVNFLALALGLG